MKGTVKMLTHFVAPGVKKLILHFVSGVNYFKPLHDQEIYCSDTYHNRLFQL